MAFTAFSATPAGAGIHPNTSYEYDCTTALSPGVAAPFLVTSNLNGAPDPSAPTGATWNASGALTFTLVGPFVAGLAANGVVGANGIGLDVANLTIASVNGTASGSYVYNHNFPESPSNVNASSLTGVSFTSGATSGTYTGGTLAAGDGLIGTGIPQADQVTSAGGGTFTLSAATTAASSGAYTAFAASILTDAAVSAGPFTTTGTNGGTSSVALTTMAGESVVGNLTVPFGGATGVGTANCLETGYDAANNPAFPQTGEATPGFPPPSFGGPESPLVLATGGTVTQTGVPAGQGITPPDAAFVNLNDVAPTPTSQTVSVGEGVPFTINLSAAAGSYPVDPNGFQIVGGSPQTIGPLTITQVGTSAVVNTTNTASSAVTETFQFNACDTLAAGSGGPVCSTVPATVTVVIGTPPVIQPFSEQVTGGQLVLSCNAPLAYISPTGQNQSPAPTASTPLLQCPEFQFPAITLDGLEQTVTGTTGPGQGASNPSGAAPGTIYISDNRGAPTDTWTLTGTFEPTAIGNGNGQNPNASCLGVDAFCNSTVVPGSAALNTATNGAHDGQIAPNYLQVGGITCKADALGGTGTPAYNPPNLNPDATPTAGGNFGSPVTLCTAAVGQSGGTFLYNATYTLTIPESVYAGNYIGSVQYTVA